MEELPVIQLKNVSKTFFIRQAEDYSIRKFITRRIFSKYRPKKIPALQGINLDILKGEFVGLIGHNGSGKSTLLRIILGAIKPDKGGTVITNGKILKLALGIGFDLNLSARHNIYVNGSIMGLTFKEIGDRFYEIVEFAGLEEFVDTPVKYYSSGMYSRLAFSIAMHAKADILLIDEFFGTVGDEEFRNKSHNYFKENVLKNKTVIFVSHSMDLIQQFCNKVYILDKGILKSTDNVASGLETYRESYA